MIIPLHDPACPEAGLHLTYGQAWRAAPEADFAPGTVIVAWSPTALHVHADLVDRDCFNPTKGHNQRHYLTGDVFEIFLRDPRVETYHEFHVTPDNAQLILCFPSSEVFFATAKGDHDRFLVPSIHGSHLASRVEVADGRWRIWAAVPLAPIAEDRGFSIGDEILASFSRYDYTHGRDKPVVSSCSPHREERFHDQRDWLRLRLG